MSELNFAQAVTINGFNIPSINKREARTTVELRDGQSFSIAGLLQTDNRRNISQLPWIGSVPVLGALFSSKSFQAEETDLVVDRHAPSRRSGRARAAIGKSAR